ncbi:hypothetical protein BVC80_9007g19 [Macleaya cordata]|uniref:Uncharacterized protein n=1 Tax=Macleaya cordata TaxID=56857 RepID=A0A200QLM0_MACCD|nr:hypothetical protein BVC80_9007g19 [Macleaya cordata]
MPRSSRHKQHKQTKHSSRDVRERSDSEEEGYLKSRNGGDEIAVRVSRDSASGEKRKIVSQSQDGNGDLFEDYVVSKRRKEGADVTDTDRWKGVEEERGMREKIDGSRADLEKSSKMKVLVDSNINKSSRRNESSTKEKNAGVVIESGEVQKNGSSKVESKYKSERDLRRKEVHQYKDGKEKERGADRDRKVRDSKRERSVDAAPGRGSEDSDLGRKQGSQSGHVEEERLRKRELENDGK